MGFKQQILNYLGATSQKDVEQLQEKVATQELLINAYDSKPKTLPSGNARETKIVEDVAGLIGKRVSVRELQLLYVNNQFIFRGVNVRADEMITRGYELKDGDDVGTKLCQDLIDVSGGENLFWQLSVNTDVAGNGYLEKVLDGTNKKIALLRHVNPVNFGYWSDKDNNEKIVLNDNGFPQSYMQVITDEEGKEKRIAVPIPRIAHLKFNTFGDEFAGISSLQPVYNTSIRLMNMEHSAAEAAVKTANPTWVVTTETKSAGELAKWANYLGKISGQEVVFLPNGVEVELKSPGNQNFSEYSNYFLDAVVADLGVPKSILTGSGGSDGGNRATTQVLSKHFYSVIRSNQRYVETLFNSIFADYGELAGFKPPKLIFNDIAEDADRNGQRATELYIAGLITLVEARDMVGLETSPDIKTELEKAKIQTLTKGIDPDKEEKKADAETFHPAKPGSPAGSQKNNKKEQKRDTDVKSVR